MQLKRVHTRITPFLYRQINASATFWLKSVPLASVLSPLLAKCYWTTAGALFSFQVEEVRPWLYVVVTGLSSRHATPCLVVEEWWSTVKRQPNIIHHQLLHFAYTRRQGGGGWVAVHSGMTSFYNDDPSTIHVLALLIIWYRIYI